MSADEPFLSRWSRRKQATAKPPTSAPARDAAAPPAAPHAASPSTSTATPNGVDEAREQTPLPALDEILSTTDIRGFLARGVPADVSRAALRRAWAADPAIRDFVGLSENAWDFNAPDGVPGFGALGAAEVRALLAQMGSERPPPAPAPAAEGESEPRQPLEADAPAEASAASDSTGEAAPHDVVKSTPGSGEASEIAASSRVETKQNKNEDVAAQDAKKSLPSSAMTGRRAHGGALPE